MQNVRTLLHQPLSHQATVARGIRFDGKAAFFDEAADVELCPAEPETGLVLLWRGRRFQALAEYISSSDFRTTAFSPDGIDAAKYGNAIFTIEHIVSAIHGLGITNCDIHVGDNGLVPFYDGSAHDFCAQILDAGIEMQDKYYRRAIHCEQTVRVADTDAFIEVTPSTTSGLRITASIEFAEPIGQQTFAYKHSPLSYCLHLAWARTFATRDFVSEEATKRHLPGFRIQYEKAGSFVETSMVVFKDGKWITTPRRPDEAIRHKVLDFIGDVALLGFDLHGDVALHKSGHALNCKFVRRLQALSRTDSGSLTMSPGGALAPKYAGDKSSFVRDVTLVDGQGCGRRERLAKTWEIQNTGNVAWAGREMVRVGPCDGWGYIRSERKTTVAPTRPGERVLVSVEIETPTIPGHYLAEWKMIDAEGDYVFPNRYPLFVRLRVE